MTKLDRYRNKILCEVRENLCSKEVHKQFHIDCFVCSKIKEMILNG